MPTTNEDLLFQLKENKFNQNAKMDTLITVIAGLTLAVTGAQDRSKEFNLKMDALDQKLERLEKKIDLGEKSLNDLSSKYIEIKSHTTANTESRKNISGSFRQLVFGLILAFVLAILGLMKK